MSSNRILVVIDASAEEQPAVARAAWLAHALQAPLELFVCHYDQYLSGERFFDGPDLAAARTEVMASMQRRLEHIAQPLIEGGLDVTTATAWDTPQHEGIVRHAVQSGAAMVLKDTQHHHLLERSVFSNTDWNLIRTCPVPLWLVKARVLQQPPTVLAAVDPMHAHDKPADLDQRILDQATRVAAATGAELHLFHAYDPTPMLAGTGGHVLTPMHLPIERISEEMRRAHGEAVSALAAAAAIPGERVHVGCGAARELLIEQCAELPADVVVMGAVARSAWQRILIGNTAEHVLDRLPCDVLVVKPEGFRTPVRQEDAFSPEG